LAVYYSVMLHPKWLRAWRGSLYPSCVSLSGCFSNRRHSYVQLCPKTRENVSEVAHARVLGLSCNYFNDSPLLIGRIEFSHNSHQKVVLRQWYPVPTKSRTARLLECCLICFHQSMLWKCLREIFLRAALCSAVSRKDWRGISAHRNKAKKRRSFVYSDPSDMTPYSCDVDAYKPELWNSDFSFTLINDCGADSS